MTIRGSQSEVFNRTGRVEISASHVKRRVEKGRIHFERLHPGEWSQSIDSDDFAAAELHLDVHSLLRLERRTVTNAIQTLDAAWPGVAVEVPNELTNGDYRVRIQVTIALPQHHTDAGRILARSDRIVIVSGPEDGGGQGPSLLRVRPAADDMPELSRLKIEENGPVLYVNKQIPGISWRELASDPKFKHSVFPSCVREILRHLVVTPEDRNRWGASWLALDGIRGLELPEIEEMSVQDAWTETTDFVEIACEHFLEQLGLTSRFAEAIGSSDNND